MSVEASKLWWILPVNEVDWVIRKVVWIHNIIKYSKFYFIKKKSNIKHQKKLNLFFKGTQKVQPPYNNFKTYAIYEFVFINLCFKFNHQWLIVLFFFLKSSLKNSLSSKSIIQDALTVTVKKTFSNLTVSLRNNSIHVAVDLISSIINNL